jgi:hypothetical protein
MHRGLADVPGQHGPYQFCDHQLAGREGRVPLRRTGQDRGTQPAGEIARQILDLPPTAETQA